MPAESSVHVWTLESLARLDGVEIPLDTVVAFFVVVGGEPPRAAWDILDDAERERAGRFLVAPAQAQFVIARAALRVVLAKALAVDPGSLCFGAGAYGKPHLVGTAAPVEFNLAHAGDRALMAISSRPVGVDIEELRPIPDMLEIAQTHFSPSERQALRSVPHGERLAAFLRCWVRKEAVIKTSGEGLQRPLDSFDVDLAPGSADALRRFEHRMGDDVPFSVTGLPAPPGYVAAGSVAARGSDIAWRVAAA